MAKKLPKKELEKMRADFDAPIDPGQTSLFDDDENGAQRWTRKGRVDTTKKPAGRPRKHNEKGRSVSFWMTDKAIRKLRTAAAARGLTAPDLLHQMIEAL